MNLDVAPPRIGVGLGPRSIAVLAVASVAGLIMFAWPLVIPVDPAPAQHADDAPLIFAVLLPVVVALVLAQLSEGGIDAKSLAMLGVLSAINAALRPTLGAGTAGVESVFFTLILAGRVFGPGFGFMLGCTSLFASALLTSGVGPWLPFQMLCSAWIGLGAGLLPKRFTGRGEIALLVCYGVLTAYAFGFLMNLWFWPFIRDIGVEGYAGGSGSLDYQPGAPVLDNLTRFTVFTLVSSTGGWDTGRALTNAVALTILGPPMLAVLRRASRRSRLS